MRFRTIGGDFLGIALRYGIYTTDNVKIIDTESVDAVPRSAPLRSTQRKAESLPFDAGIGT